MPHPLHLAVLALVLPAMAPAAAAQTYLGTATTIGTQWQAQQGNLAGYIAEGYRVAAVTQQLTPSEQGVVNLTSYFLQKENSFIRCNELTIPTMPAHPAPARKGGAGRGGRAPTAPSAPTVILGCAAAAAPGTVSFSKEASGLATILPGR